MSTLTPEQLHILQHSLGCDKYGQGKRGRDEHDGCLGFYRNRYAADPFPVMDSLVALGLMRDHGAYELAGGMHLYRVTEAGVLAMDEQSPEPPKLTRSQQRFRDFQSADTGESFREWLLRTEHNRKAERAYA